MNHTPVLKDVVLLGGGHSHIGVLKSFGMQNVGGARLTLISREIETPYSSMLPGIIAGHYKANEGHVDLIPLTEFAGARFIHDEVIGIDTKNQKVLLSKRPPISYDLLSINIGSTPCQPKLIDSKSNVIPVKPISQFLNRWEEICERIIKREGKTKIGVIGGGVGGIEVILAIDHFFSSSLDKTNLVELALITSDKNILSDERHRVAKYFHNLLTVRGIQIHTSTRITEVRQGKVISNNFELDLNEILWVTEAKPPDWLKKTGLALDDQGFLLIDNQLKSVSEPNIFATGDIATINGSSRPKSGVFAVRQAPILTNNLRAKLLHHKMSNYKPQKHFLKLISTGNKFAVATKSKWSAQGRWVWKWKNWIDKRFIEEYQVLPEMKFAKDSASLNPNNQVPMPAEHDLSKDTMRCGGCSAKVGSDVLTAALADLPLLNRDDVIVGLNTPDDAALITVPKGKLSVLSVDAFRPMISDPFLFGRITANHCLGDLHAMGADPQTAMAIVTLPVWPEKKLVNELRQMLLGAIQTFNNENVSLIGGHTSEGLEISLGFSVTGLIDENKKLLRKQEVHAGDSIILTKSIGTGTLLAAHMRAKAKGRWVNNAIESMLVSNHKAGQIMQTHGASACTDITGYGLAGHLLEMLKNSQNGATIYMNDIPVMKGALETLRMNFFSTLYPKNERFSQRINNSGAGYAHDSYPLLFDPQTSGGLLATISNEKKDKCLADLIHHGYKSSRIIGKIVESKFEKKIKLIT